MRGGSERAVCPEIKPHEQKNLPLTKSESALLFFCIEHEIMGQAP